MKIFAVNAKGLSSPVNIKTSTVKETSRLPLLPPEQSKKQQCRISTLIPICHSLSGIFYDTNDQSPAVARPSRLEQTIFIVLASLAGLAFMVVITLLLCKFQCQVGGQRDGQASDGEIHTANTSTSPLSARELVEISLLHDSSDAEGK